MMFLLDFIETLKANANIGIKVDKEGLKNFYLKQVSFMSRWKKIIAENATKSCQ